MAESPSPTRPEPARPLVTCRCGVRQFPFGAVASSGVIAALFTLLLVMSCSPALGSPAGLVTIALFWAATTIFVFLILESRSLLDALRAAIAADEGGCRIAWRGTKSYWAFEHLGACAVEHIALRDRLVLRDRTGRPVFSAVLYGQAVKDEANAMVRALEERLSQSARPLPDGLSRLGRSGLAVEHWLVALQTEVQATRGGDGFRARSLDVDVLMAALGDVTLPAESRAGAAYVLASSGRPGLAEAACRACGSSTPPIVVAMLATAVPGSEGLLPSDATGYVDVEDRKAFEQHARQVALPRG